MKKIEGSQTNKQLYPEWAKGFTNKDFNDDLDPKLEQRMRKDKILYQPYTALDYEFDFQKRQKERMRLSNEKDIVEGSVIPPRK